MAGPSHYRAFLTYGVYSRMQRVRFEGQPSKTSQSTHNTKGGTT
jgi:hypothetical protein